MGNITVAQVNSAETRSDSYNQANQMNAATYDAAGNLTGYGSGDSYEYDALHRLVRNTNAATSYHYNGDGVLMAAATGGITTTYTQDLAVSLPQILTDGTHTHIYGLDRLASVDGSGTRTWEIHDALGSVRQTLAADGSVLPGGSYAYTPFGVVAGGNTPAPFGFTGELHSEGLVYLRARWYDPAVGTFTSRDPFAGFPTQPYSLHPYQYGYSNPLLYTDASGMVALCQEGCDSDGYADNISIPKQDFRWLWFRYSTVRADPGHYTNKEGIAYDVWSSVPENNLFIMKGNGASRLLEVCYDLAPVAGNPVLLNPVGRPVCKYVFERETQADGWIALFESSKSIPGSSISGELIGAVIGCAAALMKTGGGGGNPAGAIAVCTAGMVVGAIAGGVVEAVHEYWRAHSKLVDEWRLVSNAQIIRPWNPAHRLPDGCPDEPEIVPGHPQPIPFPRR